MTTVYTGVLRRGDYSPECGNLLRNKDGKITDSRILY